MYGQILNAQTMRLFLEGKREGKISTIMELYADGLLDEETAAERLNMTVEGFLMHYKSRKRSKKDYKSSDEEDDGAESSASDAED